MRMMSAVRDNNGTSMEAIEACCGSADDACGKACCGSAGDRRTPADDGRVCILRRKYIKKLNGVSAGKILFAARLLPVQFIFSLLRIANKCANLQHIQSSQCWCDLYGSKMDQQQHRRSNEPPIALPPDQKSQAAADKASCRVI